MASSSSAPVSPVVVESESQSQSTLEPNSGSPPESPVNPHALAYVSASARWESHTIHKPDHLSRNQRGWNADTKVDRRKQFQKELESHKAVIDHHKSVRNFSSLMRDVVNDKSRRERGLEQPYIIRPGSSLRQRWDMMSLVILVYVAIFTPFQIAFLANEHDSLKPASWLFFFFCDRLVDLVFLLEIPINFRSAFIDDSGIERFNAREAASRYMKGWLGIDVLSLLPWDILGQSLGMNNSATLRIPKLLRMFRLMKLLKIFKASQVVRRLEQQLNVKYGFVRLGKFGLSVFFVGHWLACGLMLASEIHIEDLVSVGEPVCDSDDILIIRTWVDSLYCSGHCDQGTLVEECDNGQLYIAAFYWSLMTLTTIGYGDIAPKSEVEMLYVIFAMIVGGFYFAIVVGTCCSLVEGLDRLSLAFQEQLDSLNDYMSICRMPSTLRKRIRSYLWNYRDISRRTNEAEMLNLMSPALRTEVLLWNYSSAIKTVPHFFQAPDVFQVQMAEILRLQLYGPKDIISQIGAFGEPFHIIHKGEVLMHNHWLTGSQSSTRNKRLFWNERQLVFDGPCDTTIESVHFTETHTFPGNQVRALIRKFPSGHKHCKRLVVKRLWRLCIQSGFLMKAIVESRKFGAVRGRPSTCGWIPIED